MILLLLDKITVTWNLQEIDIYSSSRGKLNWEFR